MVLYCVQHPANILRAIIHKFKYHPEDNAVIISEHDMNSPYCPALEKIKYCKPFPMWPIASYNDNSKEKIVQNAEEKIGNYLNNLNINLVGFSAIYALYDLHNPFILYFELHSIKYMLIESIDNQFVFFHSGENVEAFHKDCYAYNCIVRDMHLQDGCGENCIKRWYYSEASKTVCNETESKEIFDYYGSLLSLTQKQKNLLINVYGLADYDIDAVMLFNSLGWTNWAFEYFGVNIPEKCEKAALGKVSWFYKVILDYYFSKVDFLLKLHPSSDNILKNSFNSFRQIPNHIPVELFALFNKKFKVYCPIKSGSIDIFKKIGFDVIFFDTLIVNFFKYIHFTYLAFTLIKSICQPEKITVYGIDTTQLDHFKNWAYKDFKTVKFEKLTKDNAKNANYIIAEPNAEFAEIIKDAQDYCLVIVNGDYKDDSLFVKQKMLCSIIDMSEVKQAELQKFNWTVLSKKEAAMKSVRSFCASYTLECTKVRIQSFPYIDFMEMEFEKNVSERSEIARTSDNFQKEISNLKSKINILQCYYEAEKKGLELRKLFEMLGWLKPNSKIAFYAIDEFGAMVYRICQRCGLNFSVFLSDQDRELTCIAPDNSQVRLNCKNIHSADKSLYDGIFAAIIWDAKQIDILKNKGGLFLFDAAALYLYTKAYFIDRISEIIQKNPLVKAGIFITPTLYQLSGEKSEPERYIMNHIKKTGGVCSVEDKIISEKLKTALYKDYGFDDEYISEVCTAPYPITPIDNIMLMANHSGKYSNVINHRRLTTDAPKEYKNTIYFFGDSCVTGLYVGDGETIESYLQRKLNQNGIPYLVQNCANSYGKHYDWIFTLTESMQFKPGDILIFCSQVDWLTQQHLKDNNQKFLNGILGIYTFPLFQRPHNHGEVFSDAFHFNSKGSELIAEKIFVDLQAANYFNDNFEPTEQIVSAVSVKQEKAPITTQYSEELNK